MKALLNYQRQYNCYVIDELNLSNITEAPAAMIKQYGLYGVGGLTPDNVFLGLYQGPDSNIVMFGPYQYDMSVNDVECDYQYDSKAKLSTFTLIVNGSSVYSTTYTPDLTTTDLIAGEDDEFDYLQFFKRKIDGLRGLSKK